MVKRMSMETIKSKYRWDGQDFYMHHFASSTRVLAKAKAKRLKKKYNVNYRIIPARAKGYNEFRIFTSKEIPKKRRR